MSSRRWKRQWLAVTGALDVSDKAGQGSSSSGSATTAAEQRPLTRAFIQATLERIAKDDPLWVAVACIDAARRRLAALKSDPILLRHLLAVGLAATAESTQTTLELLSSPTKAETTLRTLGARKTLLQYTRMLDVWNKVYGPEADRFASKWDVTGTGEGVTPAATDEGDDEEPDAWAELADTTPSPIAPQSLRTSALEFVLSSPSQQAMQLALAGQPTQLASFLRALPDVLSSDIYPRRLELIKALVLSTVAAGGEVSAMDDARLLPRVQDHQEVSLWTQLALSDSKVEQDFTDTQEVRQLLARRGLDAEGNAEGDADKSHSSRLSPADLSAFYKDVIISIERQLASVDQAAQLASLASSPELGLPLAGEFVRLDEDLRLLARLVYGTSSSPHARQWTLARFREACSAAATDSTSRLRLALLYIDGASDPKSDVDVARDGAIPMLRVIAQRSALQNDSKTIVDQRTQAYFVDLLLALAEQGSVRALGSLLASSNECGVALDSAAQLRVLIAAAIGLPSLDAAQHSMLGDIVRQYKSTAPSSQSGGSARSLHDLVGPTLAASSSTNTFASVFPLLAAAPLSDLHSFLARCYAFQQASLRLRRFTDVASVAWLLSLEGSREKQLDGVMRLVRSYGRSPGQVQHFPQLAEALRSHVGAKQAFDQIDLHDVARLVLEGVARAGNTQVFDLIFSSETTSGQLTAAEQETIVLDAAEELYDNASSANVHQGDMKLAHDLLLRLPKAASANVNRFKAFIEATSRLCSFRIPSELHAGTLLSPIEIRLSMDRLSLVRRLLGSRDDAYRTPDMITDIAQKLTAVPPGVRRTGDGAENDVPHRTLVDNSVLAMLTDAALAQADYTHAQASCEKLVNNASVLGKRVEQIRHSGHDDAHAGTLRLYDEVCSLAHRTCHQLSKQPDWSDYAARLRWAGYALAFCPSEQLARYLTTWRHAAQQLEDEMQANPPKALVDELQLAGLGRGAGSLGGLGGGLGAALHAGTGGLSAAGLAALSQFGGSLESYANPLGALFARAPAAIRPLAAAGGGAGGATSDAAKTDNARSAARLFDGFGGGGHDGGGNTDAGRTPSEGQPGYLDPAERAARAARRFFGGFGSGF